MSLRLARISAALCLSLLVSVAYAQEVRQDARPQPGTGRRNQDTQERAASLRKLAERLEVGRGATIADIGAGSGRDSWVFADIVGDQGRVYAEEITEDGVGKIEQEAETRGLEQITAVLGTSDSPCLPENAVDMAYTNQVYHHLAKPREMLRSIWQYLKPGGYFVVVDRRKGTLQDWVPRAEREQKHFWLAETTVVREAREEGFLFVDFGEAQWYTNDDTFVLIFQRPAGKTRGGQDPDPMPAIDASVTSLLLPADGASHERIALVALGEGRKLVGPLAAQCRGEVIDIVLEEWATQKDERPETPEGLTLRSVLTEQGDPKLGPEKLDAAYFLDTYHLLFHGGVLLPELRDRLADSGRIYVLDRIAEERYRTARRAIGA